MSEKNQGAYLQEDEIDLRELFQTIWAKKTFIVGFTLLITLFAGIYVFFKNPIPIYKGTLLVEIGEVQSDDFGRLYLDNPRNLAVILENSQNIEASVPGGTNSLVTLSSTAQDKQQITKDLNSAYEFILQRDKQKAKVFQNVIMTKQVGGIKIGQKPINQPKKKLIVMVAFVTGLILSIFLVFFMEFIRTFKEEK